MPFKTTFKRLLFTILLITPYVSLANSDIDMTTLEYSRAESAKVGDFTLWTKFNIVAMPEQKLSVLLSKRIADFIKSKGINTMVRSNSLASRNIIINHIDMIEGYGRGEDAYRIKIARNDIIIEYTSSMSLYWAYDAFILNFVDDKSFIAKIIKKRRYFIERGYFVSNDGVESVSDMIRISSELLTKQRIKDHINKAVTSNISTIYIELLSKDACKLKTKSMELFNPNSSFVSEDAMTVAELEQLNQYAISLGVTIVPVLDFSSEVNEVFTAFTGHETFSVEGVRFSRAVLKDLCEGTSLVEVCLGKKIDNKLIQIKYIDPLVDLLRKNGKRAVAL